MSVNKLIENLSEKTSNLDTESAIAVVYEALGNNIKLASSLSYEDQVLTHMICKFIDSPKIFVLDTGRLHEETYNVLAKTNKKYKIDYEIYYPNTDSIESFVKSNGINSFYESIENRKMCCKIRKTEPLARALENADGWITGIRKEQSVTRENIQLIEYDNQHNIIKFNPLLNWTEKDIIDYVKANDIPYNELHDKGFPSIGCAPCSRAIKPGDDLRSGRWWWESPEQKECGLHIQNGKIIRKKDLG